jgi:hypothetical protein
LSAPQGAEYGGIMHDYSTIIARLEELVSSGATGTLFVTTSDKQSIRVGLRNGEIVSIVHRATHGRAAIDVLTSVKQATSTFQQDFVVTSTRTDALPSTFDVLTALRRVLK